MKKISVALIIGIFSGGIIGFIFLYLFTGRFRNVFIQFFAISNLILFIFVGAMISLCVFYKQKYNADEKIIAKHQGDNKAKDDMISMTLHHIRTPLTGMMWSTKELCNELPNEHPEKNRVTKLYEETVRILGTVEKLLKASRENNGRSSYCFELYSSEKLEHLISESISKMKPAAYAKELSVETETSPLSQKVAKIDGDKIITAVQTLFENAVHYTKSGGGIKIKMEEKCDNFCFYIKDTGVGIPADEQKNIFNQFYRSTNAKRIRADGLGIGLFLAKSFIDAHGGSITFDSTSHGTTFTVHIPLSDPTKIPAPKTSPVPETK